MNGLNIAILAILAGFIARLWDKLNLAQHERDQWRQTALDINQQINERK